jgi:tritrans,polycis-undecaprenyl-diphosphate synthase [geranylgeranyl-diphosphate specific]
MDAIGISNLAIIMDGNRRYARERGLRLDEVYRLGAEKVKELLEWCRDYEIKVVTLYALSLENLERSEDELAPIFDLVRKEWKSFLKKFHENGVKVRIIGRKEVLPEDIRDIIRKLEEETEAHQRYRLNIAVAYGGRQEIIDAARIVASEYKSGRISLDEIDDGFLRSKLYLESDPDLVIRTGGEKRLSNFLLYQCAYSEFVFLDKLFPEITRQDFDNAIHEYRRRKRRFGR